MMDKAIILAAGRGSRMRRASDAAGLTSNQAEVASSGMKSMMPVGRPFIDYVLAGLAEAGYRRICLVIGPDHHSLQAHCSRHLNGALEIQFATQREPLGTAHALACAREFAADDPFLTINADNYYPVNVLARMRDVNGSAVAAFKPEGLYRGNITPERLRSFAIILSNTAGDLSKVVEKPGDEFSISNDRAVLINMNCWRFTPAIFDACGAIPKSARNEFELPDAVSYAIDVLHERFAVVEVSEPVLDLSTRADVVEITRRLAAVEVRL